MMRRSSWNDLPPVDVVAVDRLRGTLRHLEHDALELGPEPAQVGRGRATVKSNSSRRVQIGRCGPVTAERMPRPCRSRASRLGERGMATRRERGMPSIVMSAPLATLVEP